MASPRTRKAFRPQARQGTAAVPLPVADTEPRTPGELRGVDRILAMRRAYRRLREQLER